MIDLKGVRVGFVMTGSFCTFAEAFAAAEALRQAGASLLPVMSEHAAGTDTRFGSALSHIQRLETICEKPVIRSIPEAEPIGPKHLTDILVVAPCTGNTLAKLAASITDTTATMAVKSHLRTGNPVVLAVATNAHQVQKVNDHVANAMQTARRHGLECYAFAGMHQDYPDFAAEIERCRALGFTGFKIHPDIQRMDLLSPAMYALCEALEGNMPLFLHMGDCRAEYRFSEPEKLVTLTRRFPCLQVVAAHYGGYQAWDDAVHCLAGVPNVWFDCSSALWAMTPERAYALTETMGFDRVMYGSDYPVYGLADYLELFSRVPFSPAQRSAILYDNAQRFLHACGAL